VLAVLAVAAQHGLDHSPVAQEILQAHSHRREVMAEMELKLPLNLLEVAGVVHRLRALLELRTQAATVAMEPHLVLAAHLLLTQAVVAAVVKTHLLLVSMERAGLAAVAMLVRQEGLLAQPTLAAAVAAVVTT
jgi:hypothetical protein